MSDILSRATISQLKRRVDGLDAATIYGASWDKGVSPLLKRTDASIGLIARVGVDGLVPQNDFNNAAIYRDITEVTDSLGNVFVRIPKFYIRKTDGVNLRTWQISKTQYPGFYLPWCFWDFTNSRELPYIDIGKYKGTLEAGNKLGSKPNVYPVINQNIVTMRTYARANNVDGLKGYQQLDAHTYDMLTALFYVEFATLHSQSIMQGYATGQYSVTHVAVLTESAVNRIVLANAFADTYRVGQHISCGTSLGGQQVFTSRQILSINVVDASNKSLVFDGATVNIATGNIVYNSVWKNGFSAGIAAKSGSIISNTDGRYPMVYRGLESLYGDMWQFVDGVNINERQVWVTKNAEDYTSNVFAHPYEQLGYINHNADGYITAMGYDPSRPWAEFPTVVGGSSTTRYADYYYQAAGQRIAIVGGRWNSGAYAGLSFWHLSYSSSDAYLSIGARLLKKPL